MNIHSKFFFDKLLNYKSIMLCVNDRENCRNATKELKKCNHEYVQDYFRSKICSFSSKTCYNNYVSNISVLVGLCQVLTIQLAHASETAPAETVGNEQLSTQESKENSDDSFIGTVTRYLKSGFDCISGNNTSDSGCVQRIFLILSLVGTFLSLIGAVFSLLYRFCSCFMCCRRSRTRPMNQVNYNNQQLDLMKMQMQQQQQQMCNALMGAALARKGKMSKETKKKGNKKGGKLRKNKNSSNGTNKSRSKNSKDKEIHIGYQQANE
ncbi:hypothetical protein POCGH01_00101500 [Plasmodium ovale]|uniref:Uncharacterized protein n=1 Tax=Plasmodium ovale TaxID=36330 RepID=A0A1D3JCE2_PLAOA|nr:hypothetical protein POCGH01_00101500 [Plasmodium ovale]